MGSYVRPASLAQALQERAKHPCTVLAGGTDFHPARVGKVVDEAILDISGIAGLRGINVTDAGVRLGATTTWTDVARNALPPAMHCLGQAAREVGGVQIQNAATVAGNLCNASPAADSVPALLALDASVELASERAVRTLPLASFLLGARRTACAADELVTAIVVPSRSPRARSSFRKLGARRYLVISIAMVAVCLDADAHGRVCHAGIAVGACSAVAQRLPILEARVIGMPLLEAGTLPIGPADLASLTPLDDIRASATYRVEAVIELLRRALDDCGRGAAS